ncbi:MarR family transcriptional regulator [Halomarina halobia]|uniref:MarR family transcriptional regulator n=1 Tax=Halomarina halobia TaxID=3033386 RepID=A0ABD6ADM3_9EURY|nr:hypothetical protein [Halomarina sp. PSR21]
MYRERRSRAVDTTETAVLETLGSSGPLRAIDVAAEIDAHPVRVDRICARLRSEGYVSAIGGGVYALTAAGERALEAARTDEEPD